MKKTLIALMVLASAASYGATTTIATMKDLVEKSTIGNAVVSTEYETSDINGGVYTFTDNNYLGGIEIDSLVQEFLNTTTGSKYITVAAWVRPTSTTGVQSVFSFGDQSDGIKFCLDGANLKLTTKGVKDFDSSGSGNLGVKANEWNLVAFTFPGTTQNADIRYLIGDSGNSYWTKTNISYTDNGIKAPASEHQAFAIGNGNDASVREVFTGDIANLTILGSDAKLENPAIAALVLKPTEIPTTPEPATATLSLLALAGLAARRRRK